MKKNDNPAVIFNRLSAIKNQYNTKAKKIDEADLIAVVIDAAPESYQSVLTMEQMRLSDAITLEDLNKAMNAHWRSIGGTDSKGIENDEMVLGAFAGFCFECKKQGHKSHECPSKKEGGKSGGGGKWDSKKFSGKCNHCGKEGHKSDACWKKEENKDKRPKWLKEKDSTGGELANANVDGNEFLLMASSPALSLPTSQHILNDPDVFIADSAASVHTSPHNVGMQNFRAATEADDITVANGDTESAKKIADLKGTRCDKHGNAVEEFEMTDITLLPGGKFNLFSLSRLKKGWILGGDLTGIWLKLGAKTIYFDIVIPTKKGFLVAMYFRRNREVAAAITDGPSKKMTINEAHEMLGHGNEYATRKAAKELEIEITKGTMNVCEACTVAKSKQKNVAKVSDHVKATGDVSRMFLDISSIKEIKDGPKVTNPNWRLMVEERTGLKFSNFYATKNGMIEPTCEQLHKLKLDGKAVKFMRLDNAGENQLLQKRSDSKDWKLNIKFEFTARDTPQQNHLAELGFAHLASKGRAMMISANIPLTLRYKLFKEAFKTATLLDGLMAVTLEGVTATRYKHYMGENPDYAYHLRTWGEAGTVKTKTLATPKIGDRGVQCMFVGYAADHAGDCYRMWDPKTSRVHATRDIIWLKRSFYPKPAVALEVAVPENVTETDPASEAGESEAINPTTGESGVTEVDEVDDSDKNEVQKTGMTTRSGRAVGMPVRLIQEIGAVAAEHYEIGLTEAERSYYQAMAENEAGNEVAAVGAGLGGGFENTSELRVMKFKEAMKGSDNENWQKAVDEEHDRMQKHRVWEAVLRDGIPAQAKILTSTWAMKKKSNGVYRARLNARGYEQVDGVHYDSHNISAPVTNDVTIRIVMVLMIMGGWVGELLDVKGAFLHGDFEEDRNVYMEVPEGFEKYYDPRIYVLYLLQTIYGLKQSAKAFWTKLLKAFRSMDFERSKADPCLYFAWTVNGLVLWVSWIDDCLVLGNKIGVEIAKAQMMNRFDCDEVGNMDEYVGCKLERNWDEGWIRFLQPVLLQSYKDEFNLPDEKEPKTPAETGQILMPCNENDGVSPAEQGRYRSGTGKLLHMMRWSRPDILNAVRELSKNMKAASEVHMKAMQRTMRYCLATPERGLLLKPNGKWNGDPNYEFEIKGRSDANYATDPATRRSVSGSSVFLEGAPVVAKSNGQKSVTLSTAESELSAGTSCAQEMLYVMRVMESIGLKVKKPMILEMDSKAAVDLANNWSVGGRTRHIEVKQYFLRELKEEDILLAVWISGATMSSDIFTKNVERTLFEKHTKVYCGDDEYMKS
jgi:hypothetical protein